MELCNLGAARTIIAKQGTQAGHLYCTVGIFNLICDVVVKIGF